MKGICFGDNLLFFSVALIFVCYIYQDILIDEVITRLVS